MDNYKFYRKDNYIVLSNDNTKETFYGFVKEVLVDKSNLNKAHYRFFNIKDWNSDTPLLITQLLEEDGSPYTQIDFEEFYRQNTGNFNGGGSAPGVQSVTGVGVDNSDPLNPVITGGGILPTGTERQVVGFDGSGNAEAVTIGWKQLSDLPSPPTFSNGIYTGTAFQPDGSATFAFLELGIDSPDSVARPNNIPIYQAGTIGTGGGTLPVQDPIEDLDAVNKQWFLANKGAGSENRIIFLSDKGCISDADISLNSSTFGTDNTSIIQSILDEASFDNRLLVYWDGKYSVTGLNIKSYTTIIALEGCGAILRDNSDKAILSNYNALPVSLPGVFPDTNISITGGIWNGNGYREGLSKQMHSSSTYGFVTGIRMYGVKNIQLKDINLINTRTYACLFHTNENVVVENMNIYQGETVYVNQDGLDFDGYQNNIKVNGLRAKCGDDAITLNTSLLKNGVDPGDYTVYFGKSGSATNVDFQNLYFDNSQMGIRLLSGNKLIDNVSIRNVEGICQAYWLVIDNYLQNPAGLEDAGPGNVGKVLIENINVTNLSGTAYGGNFAKASLNCNAERITLRNYMRNDFSVNNNPSFMVKGVNTVLKTLNIENYYSNDPYTTSTISHFVIDGATVGILNISAYVERNTIPNDSPLVEILNLAKVDKLLINGVTILGSDNLLNNSASLKYIRAIGVHHVASNDVTPTFKTTTTIDDIVLSNYYGFNRIEGTFTKTRGDGFLDDLPNVPPSNLLLDLFGYWKEDENSGNSIDSTGNNYTLTNTGSVLYSTGKINNSAEFTGSNYLTGIVPVTGEKISINTWVNINSFSGIQMILSNEERVDNKYGISLYTNGSVVGNKLILSIGNGSTHTDITIDQVLNMNVWYMFTVTFNSGILLAYINGILVKTQTMSNTLIGSNTGNRFRLGAEAGITPLYFFSGKIDELGVWNRQIINSEIQELYNLGIGKSYPF